MKRLLLVLMFAMLLVGTIENPSGFQMFGSYEPSQASAWTGGII